MKRGEVTTVEKLIQGDRFYKQSDKKKISYEFIGPEAYGKFEVCNAAFMFSGCIPPPKKVEVFKGETIAVFLRNVNQ